MITVQSLAHVNSCLEKVHDFLLGLVAVITAWLESADACSVFVPFVLLEAFVIARVIFPILFHICQKLVLPIRS